MLLSVFGFFIEEDFAEVDLIGELGLFAFAECPDGTADCGQGLHDALQELRVKLLGSHVALGELRDFADQAANLLLGLFDGLSADLRLSRSHWRFVVW